MSDILAGVGTLVLRDGAGNLVLSSNVLTTSGVNISTNAVEQRGGLGNFLIGQYFTDGNVALTLENATFAPEYIALNVGSEITIGTDVPVQETITVGAGGAITVVGTPKAIGALGTIGWYKKAGSEAWITAPITFTGKTATVGGLTEGTIVCVRYSATDAAAKKLVIPGTIIPKILHATLTIPKFATGTSEFAASAQSGEIIIDIPSFQLDGNVNLSLTSNGVATVPLSGKALRTVVDAQPCDMFGEFGTIVDRTYGARWYDELTQMAVDGADIQLTTTGGDYTMKVIGVFGTATGILDNANLTFTSGTTATCTVTNGVIHPIAIGTSLIHVTVAEKPEIDCYANVTVA